MTNTESIMHIIGLVGGFMAAIILAMFCIRVFNSTGKFCKSLIPKKKK